MSGSDVMLWTKSFFFRSWESCAGIAGIGCAIEHGPKLFPPQFDAEILRVQVDMLNNANDPSEPLYVSIFEWAREIETDRTEIKIKLSDLLSQERRQIRDLEFLRVA